MQTVKFGIFTKHSSKTTSSYKENRGAEAAADRGEIRYWFIDDTTTTTTNTLQPVKPNRNKYNPRNISAFISINH